MNDLLWPYALTYFLVFLLVWIYLRDKLKPWVLATIAHLSTYTFWLLAMILVIGMDQFIKITAFAAYFFIVSVGLRLLLQILFDRRPKQPSMPEVDFSDEASIIEALKKNEQKNF